MNLKYQIFVSSTYEDLKKEREQVVKAILEMGHIPVGMEMFSAADEEQWQLIKRQIEESDYYVVIAAHRYGSLDSHISYTEKEYDHAVSRGIPTLGFIITDSASWPKDQVDTDSMSVAALTAFKEKIRRKHVSFWNSAEDLHGKVSIALMKQMNTHPRTGWVRSSQSVAPEMTAELTRLSSENSELRHRLEQVTVDSKQEESRERERTIKILHKTEVESRVRYYGSEDWTKGKALTLYQMFNAIAPSLIIECSTADVATLLALRVREGKKKISHNWPLPSNIVQSWLADLASFDLVEESKKQHAVSDKEEYWKLTKKGQALYLHLRRARLEVGLEESPVPDATSEIVPEKPSTRGKN